MSYVVDKTEDLFEDTGDNIAKPFEDAGHQIDDAGREVEDFVNDKEGQEAAEAAAAAQESAAQQGIDFGKEQYEDFLGFTQPYRDAGESFLPQLTEFLDPEVQAQFKADALAGQVDFLPSLRDGEAFVSGDSINLPRKVQFREPNPMPNSNDVRYHKSWKSGKPADYSLKNLVDCWYKQNKTLKSNEN